mmetsp:Transcript_25967/g.78096  ORF Transcript_25967/g.78096 Transcript_25967/m.78096 type:complete len:308 (+) Transcript_25967:186-1109(+)
MPILLQANRTHRASPRRRQRRKSPVTALRRTIAPPTDATWTRTTTVQRSAATEPRERRPPPIPRRPMLRKASRSTRAGPPCSRRKKKWATLHFGERRPCRGSVPASPRTRRRITWTSRSSGDRPAFLATSATPSGLKSWPSGRKLRPRRPALKALLQKRARRRPRSERLTPRRNLKRWPRVVPRGTSRAPEQATLKPRRVPQRRRQTRVPTWPLKANPSKTAATRPPRAARAPRSPTAAKTKSHLTAGTRLRSRPTRSRKLKKSPALTTLPTPLRRLEPKARPRSMRRVKPKIRPQTPRSQPQLMAS